MKKIRTIIDVAMTVLLPMLMAYSLIGEAFHEIIGTLMFVLFVAHNWLNRGFWKGLFNGKYNPQRIFRTIVNVALLIVMILQPLSGIVMSKHLYTFLPTLGISATARQIHLVLAYWGFVLMSMHAGMHMDITVGKIKKKQPKVVKILETVFLCVSAYGIYAFMKRQIPDYMFMKMPFAFFDFNEPRVFFFADYIAVMVLFGLVGYICMKLLKQINWKGISL